MEKPHTDKDRLRRMYVGERMSQKEIGEELGCHRGTVARWLRKHSIPIRDNSESKQALDSDSPWRDADTLRDLIYGEEMSLAEVSDELGCSQATVSKWCDELGVEKRTGSETRELRGTANNGYPDGPHRDPEWLSEMYYEEEMKLREMADKAGVGETAILRNMEKHGLERRTAGDYLRKDNKLRHKPGTCHEQIRLTIDGTSHYYTVHRMLAIAIWGLDEVGGKIVHHKNGIAWDNRPSNLELIESQSEHAKLHNHGGGRDKHGRFTSRTDIVESTD